MTEKCMMCDKDAVYVRSTQFAGDHPFCEEHAKMETDFGQSDSYTYWYPVKSNSVNRPSKHDVEIGRITKKMNKMKDQRDKARKDIELYKQMLQIVPHIASRYEEYQKRKALEEEVRMLRLRVKEQSMLIAKLTV